jgi:hypothetical protein
MNFKAGIFFLFSLIIFSCAIAYLIMNLTVKDDHTNFKCMIFNYRLGSSVYIPTYCTNDDNYYQVLKNSIFTLHVLSIIYPCCLVVYLIINYLFHSCIGVNRINECTIHLTLLNKPEDGGFSCLCQFFQGFFMATFLVIVAPVVLFLFIGQLCYPRPIIKTNQYPHRNPYPNSYPYAYAATYNYASADNIGYGANKNGM